jgi:RNA polymerase sigma factor (sigma-70 family)
MNKAYFPQSDAELIEAICGSRNERDAALHYLFNENNWFNRVRNYVVAQGGTAEDGEDVFQESVILFDRNIRQGRFKNESSLLTYFFGIAKWFWVTERRKQKTFNELSDSLKDLNEGIEAELIETENRQMLTGILSQIGEKCKDLILLTGIATHKEIADIKGYSSADMAKKEVFRCRKKLRQLIEQHPHLDIILKSIMHK